MVSRYTASFLAFATSSTSKDKIAEIMELDAIQAALQQAQLDGWLFYDHHHRDPIAYRILGLSESLHISRRWYYFVPAAGEPRKLVHRVEGSRLDPLPGKAQLYSSWQELEAGLRQMLNGAERIAMQYSPRNAIMYVSMVDAGTIEVLRELGKTIVSSADLVSRFEAVLTPEQEKSHFEAQAQARCDSRGRLSTKSAAACDRQPALPNTRWSSGSSTPWPMPGWSGSMARMSR